VGFVAEARAAAESLAVPKSVLVEWGGQFENFNRAKTRLAILGPVALAGVSIMLVLVFGRIRYTAVAVASLPFALAGGVAALVVRGLPFSIPAGVGFIALTGIAVCTGVVVITAVLQTPRSLPPEERVRRGLELSLRAPISTALVAALGFVPAAIATGTGAEVQRPLATVVIGGLIVSTVLSLLALPASLVLAQATVEGFARLPKVFKKDGVVHPGAASGINDGAASAVMATSATSTGGATNRPDAASSADRSGRVGEGEDSVLIVSVGRASRP
jgi:cobalt-zinc-cadmium resistance protein CzcA